ncbi:MAG: CocE/NonD family hydrolase, partial [Thermomicrobiales bacterium]|nr:CocE/NonD family hydrolase [Thermomicrobiales bacterium]
SAPNPYPIHETGIPMRDGSELAASVCLPHHSERPAPAIVTITPYDKSGTVGPGSEGEFYQRHGYVFVTVDCRGRGKSEGEWRAFFNDPDDGHDVIEWVARQPWCTGKVGTTGLSYSGWTQWAAASRRPEHLTCMVSSSAAGRWQQEIPYTSGCFQLFFGWWVYAVRRRIIERGGLRDVDWDELLRTLPLDALGDFIDPSGETWRDLMDHDTLDELWRSIRFDDRYDQFDCPCLHVTGWYDLEDLTGAFHHYELMMANSPAADRQRLIVGPWSHVMTRRPHHTYGGVAFGEAAAPDMNHVHLRWFDYWLKGIENGALDEAPVQLFEPGSNRWVDAERWPLATEERTLHLTAEGLSSSPGEAQPRSYRYDPDDPAPTQIDVTRYPFENPPLDQRAVEARSDVLTWTSEPLEGELVISGWPALDLVVSSDCDDTEFHVKITDVTPEGESLKVAQGCLRASYRDSLEHPQPLVPGEPTRLSIEIWPIHHCFQPGHRVRVSVTSADFPWFARSLNQFGPLKSQTEPKVAINTIHAGQLRLPVRADVDVTLKGTIA